MVKPNTFIVHSQIQMLTRLDTILFEMIPRVIYSLEIIPIFNYKAWLSVHPHSKQKL